MSEEPTTKEKITLKVTSKPDLIYKFVGECLEKTYLPESIKLSALLKNANDIYHHIFVEIILAPPKEQTDVKVREVP
jgi:hypothetical protein